MAGVPTYDNFRVAPQGQTGFPISVPSTDGFGEPARQVARSAQVADRAGGPLRDIAIQIQDEANQTRVMEAANAAREAALRLAYDPEEGYTHIRGGDVLPRDGKPLAVDYTGKFDEQLRTIGEGLANDEQRRMFAFEAGRLRMSFEAGATEHEAREWSGYELSVAEGARTLAIEAIAQARNNPAAIDTELGTLDVAVARLGELKGLSGNEIAAMQAANRSAAIRQSIASAIAADDLTTADGLYQRYGAALIEADDIAVKGVLEREMDGRLVMEVADVAEGLAPVIEGGGAQGSAGGATKPVENAAAIVRQLLPGVRVTQNRRNPNSRLGRANPNSWHNRSGGAIDVAPVPGMTFEQYVAKFRAAGYTIIEAIDEVKNPSSHSTGPHWHLVLGEPGSGTGRSAPQRTVRPATLDEMWDAARARLLERRPDASPELIRAARDEVESRWSMRERSRAAAEDGTMQQVYTALARNGGSVQALPAALRNSIPGDRLPSVFEFARSIQRGNDRSESDPATYLRLSDPTTLAGMSESEFMALKPKLTDSDFQQFARDRGNVRMAIARGQQTAAQQAGALPREAVNRVVNNRLVAHGLPTSVTASTDEGDAVKVAAVRMFVGRAILGEQARLGRQLTEVEVTQFADRLFADSASVDGWFRNYPRPVVRFSFDQIPAEDREGIVAALKRRGNAAPSDADILAAWYELERSR